MAGPLGENSGHYCCLETNPYILFGTMYAPGEGVGKGQVPFIWSLSNYPKA
jgi:hypothetical protein